MDFAPPSLYRGTMKTVAALAAALALAACASPGDGAASNQEDMAMAAAGNAMGGMDESETCPLRVEFGSYAMGIDGETLRRVEALLAADAAVTGVTREQRGREGETMLCVSARSVTDRDRLFREIGALFPNDPRGPLTVRTDSGLRFEAGNLPG